MKYLKAENTFNVIFTVLFCILIIGTPLVFTSLTRSVFEVNKLLLLRLFLLVTTTVWLFKSILYKSNHVESTENTVNFFGFQWKKTGIEIPMIIWLISNILSTIFSTNKVVSLIGAYDRWEGILTMVNYIVLVLIFAKLLTKRFQLNWMIAALGLATFGSAIYGILQSLGIDFMRWSVDPTARVFACINNPVHYCAFMGMVTPLLIGWHLKLCKNNDSPQNEAGKWILFVASAVIYYTMYLSYSRATWMGFIGAMPLLYMLGHDVFFKRNKNIFITDIFFTLLAISSFFITAIFKLNQLGLWYGLPTYIVVTAYLIFVGYNNKVEHQKDSRKADIIIIPAILAISLLSFLIPHPIFQTFNMNGLGIKVGLGLILLVSTYKSSPNAKLLISRIAIILFFTKLQFVTNSVYAVVDYFAALGMFYLATYSSDNKQHEERFWLTAYAVMFALVIIIPSFSNLAESITAKETDGLPAAHAARVKVSSYKRDAIKGTARTSMWKSAIPWIKDYPILGSGLDTIKYQYPNYRLPDYGKLEGGHNFTPDRLHNEYLNTLATKGVVGFISYYLIFILTWLLICIKGLYRFIDTKNPYQFLLLGTVVGGLVYLGQVLFNFGVVATLVLFYILLGSGIAISNGSDFKNEQ